MAKGNGPPAGDELRMLIERAERVKEEIKEMQADLKDVFGEAKSRGFDVKTIQRVMRLRAMKPEDRREMSALDQIYMTALGMGDGSLSDMAREYLAQKNQPNRVEPIGEDGQHDAFPTPKEGNRGPVEEGFGDDLSDKPISEEDAQRLGSDAARAGKPVTANPFKAGDDRRAAWDAGWCGALGSDGMDIPPELRPNPKPKKDDDKAGDDKSDGKGKDK